MSDRRNQPPVLLLNPTDPLVVATRDLAVGEAVGLGDITPIEPIGRGHKLAIKPIESGAPVRKLGQVIGIATHVVLVEHTCADAPEETQHRALKDFAAR